MTQTQIQRRRINAPEQADDARFRGSAAGARAQEHPGGNGDNCQGQDQRTRNCADDRGRQRTVHAPFNTGHGKQRRENRNDDQRRKNDRTPDLDGRPERILPPCFGGAGGNPVDDVFGHDDSGVREKPDRDGQAPERRGVDADARGLQKQARQGDRERQRHGHNERGAQIAQQQEQHAHHQKRAQKDRAAHSS